MTLELIDTWTQDGRADAVAAAVVRPDGASERRFAGAAGERSLFALASVSKPIVAIAALVAAEEGAIDLDRPVADHLPAYADAARAAITPRHLLSHASGLPESSRGTPPLEVQPVRAPGVRRVYSNEGFHVLGLLLAEATGIELPRYLREAVLEPLGMEAFMPLPEPEYGRALEVRDPGLSAPGIALFNDAGWRRRINAAGGVFATLDGVARFAQMLLARGAPLLADETFEEFADVQFPGIPGGLESFTKLHCPDWGLGMNVRGHGSPHWLGDGVAASTLSHFGASGTLLFADPHSGVGLVCLANRGTYSGWMLAEGGWTELSGEVIAEHGAPG